MIEQAYRDATLRVATYRNAVLCAWREAPTLEQMRAVGRVSRTIARATARRSLFWSAVLSGTPSFSAEVRQELNTLTADPALQGIANAHVILIGGFAGAATRGFLGAAFLASRPPTPTKVFGDVDAAALWMGERGANDAGSPTAAQWRTLHAELIAG